MKKCPKCESVYTDETLVYCLTDGAALKVELPGEKTEEFQNPITNEAQSESKERQTEPLFSSDPTARFTKSVEDKSSGSFWKLTTFGLIGILIAVIAVFWFVYPERFQGLGSLIPIPGFSSASQQSEFGEESGRKSEAVKKNSQTTNLNGPGGADPASAPTGDKKRDPETDIAGEWELTVKTPRRSYPFFLTLERDEDGEIKGTSRSPLATTEITEATFEEGVLTVKQDDPFSITFIGNVSGNEIEGKVVTKLGPTTFTGNKVESSKEIENGRS